MTVYTAKVPIVGYAVVYVEAPDEEFAAEMALSSVMIDNIAEWEAVRQVCRGNVFYGPLNEIEVEADE